jgi:hypothetical protein
MTSETIPTFAQFRDYMQEMEGFELNLLVEGEMAVVRADEHGLTLFARATDTQEVYFDALAPWFDKLLMQRFLPVALLEEPFGEATPLAAALFLQLDGVRYEADTETLYWFDPTA